MLDEDEPGRRDAGDLPAELGADRAAGTGDEHRLARQVLGDRVDIHLDGLAAENVLHLDRADLAGEVQVARDELVETGQRLDGDVRVLGDLDHLLPRLARRRRDCDQDLVGWIVSKDVRKVGRRPEDTDAVQAKILLARIVVDEADRRVAERGCLQHLADDELGGVARADDDDLLAARDERGRAGTLDQAARDQACAGDEREQDQPVEHRDRAWQRETLDGMCEVDDEVRDD